MENEDCEAFNNSGNHQNFTSDPRHIAYQNTAINFTNENWHYSLTTKDSQKILLPGCHISEKTFKCLLSATAFVPVGQYDTYRSLSELGFKFDYGFDQSFDQIPGDIDRLCQIVKLIDELNTYSAQELHDMTAESSMHNQDHVISKRFYQKCEQVNHNSLEQIDEILKHV
jgi:hypothetical protein